MKKQILLVGIIAVFGLSVFLASYCEKENEKVVEQKSCTCKVYTLKGEYLGTDDDWGELLRGYKNCSEFQTFINEFALDNDFDRKYQCF